MKNAWISGGILALIFIFVGINSHVLDKMIVELEERVCAWESGDEEEFKKIYEEYDARSWYINLTVSHNLTSEVEEAFSEVNGAIAAGDGDGIIEAKSRLTDAIRQLRRLTRFSFDSII